MLVQRATTRSQHQQHSIVCLSNRAHWAFLQIYLAENWSIHGNHGKSSASTCCHLPFNNSLPSTLGSRCIALHFWVSLSLSDAKKPQPRDNSILRYEPFGWRLVNALWRSVVSLQEILWVNNWISFDTKPSQPRCLSQLHIQDPAWIYMLHFISSVYNSFKSERSKKQGKTFMGLVYWELNPFLVALETPH